MEKTFVQIRDARNIAKTKEILLELPNYVEQYFNSIQNRTSTLTQMNYAHDLRLFFYYLVNVKKMFTSMKKVSCLNLEQLNYNDFEAYLNWLTHYEIDDAEHTNSLSGKARKLASLRSFFNYLFKVNLISSNQIEKVDTPKLHDKDITRLEPNEMVEVLDEVTSLSTFSRQNKKYISHMSERDNAIMYLFLSTGIRISELVGIDKSDINFEENAFKITRKGGNKAIMYFPEETKEVLLDYKRVRDKVEPLPGHTNAFFLSTQKKRISVRAVEDLVKKYTKNVVHLKNISPHKLRSTFGTNLYRETQDIYIVATMLGHKDVNTTKKHYAAISEDLKRETANKVKLKK